MRRSTRGTPAFVAIGILTLSIAQSPRQLWAQRYDGPVHAYDYGQSIGVSPDGTTVYVAGSSEGDGTSLDYVTIAYDASTGATDWLSRFDRPTAAYDEALALAVSLDGTRVFVTGWSNPTGWSPDFATVAYDARTGDQLWTAIYGGGYDLAFAIAVSPDGSKVFVTGVGGPDSNPTTVAYDAATGEQLWVQVVAEQGDGFAIGASPDGSLVYVTGTCVCSRGEDFLTVAYDASTGSEVWRATYDGPSHAQDDAVGLAVSPDGSRVFVAGLSADRQGYGYATLAYDALTGTGLWNTRYHGSHGGGGFAAALGVSPDGTAVYVTGNLTPPGKLSRYATVAYEAATGATRWVATFTGRGAGNEQASDLVVSPAGDRVYVTGQSFAPNGAPAYGTVGYDAASGALAWSELYVGPDAQDDEAYAIAISPDGGRVFVTGRSYGPNDADAATISYGA